MFKGHGGKGKAPWKKSFGNDDRERSSLHPATCNECGDACQVPFKPNGRKPVFCSNCFIRAEKFEYRFENDAPRRSFGDKRPAFQSRERGDNRDAEIVKQLKEISAKLDVLIATSRS